MVKLGVYNVRLLYRNRASAGFIVVVLVCNSGSTFKTSLANGDFISSHKCLQCEVSARGDLSCLRRRGK